MRNISTLKIAPVKRIWLEGRVVRVTAKRYATGVYIGGTHLQLNFNYYEERGLKVMVVK